MVVLRIYSALIYWVDSRVHAFVGAHTQKRQAEILPIVVYANNVKRMDHI